MIQIRCKTDKTRKLSEMIPLQGALKHRTQAQIDALVLSLKEDGLLQPLSLWHDYVLDGHGRHAAISQLAFVDETVKEQDWPVVEVEADTLEEAREILLTMNVTYGKITPKGLNAYLSESPSIKVPSSMQIKVKTGTVATMAPPSIVDPVSRPEVRDFAVMKLRVKKEQVEAFTSILATLSYVEIV